MLKNETPLETYKIVYCSRNALAESDGGTAAIRGILLKSRENNRRANVSGALLFNAGCFAQVLEGSREAVEQTFERIACEARHRDITVLEAGVSGPRVFDEWSMAYAGTVADDALPLLVSTLNAAFA